LSVVETRFNLVAARKRHADRRFRVAIERNRLTHFLADRAHRPARYAGPADDFGVRKSRQDEKPNLLALDVADAEWIEVAAQTERDGPLVQNIANQLLRPTVFSAMK